MTIIKGKINFFEKAFFSKLLTFLKAKFSKIETKFGGQPDWLDSPQWPISFSTGEPMQFIGQIAIEGNIFGQRKGKVAYIFMANNSCKTWDPNSGDNAVIIQPEGYLPVIRSSKVKGSVLLSSIFSNSPITDSSTKTNNNSLEIMNQKTGPTIENKEYFVKMTVEEEVLPFHYNDEELSNKEFQEKDNEYFNLLRINKIGGTPAFIQEEDFPQDKENWDLLLQLDSMQVPFEINFGDAGVGYIFINKEGTKGHFLWQCH